MVIVQKTRKPGIGPQNANGIWKHQIYTPYLTGQGVDRNDGYFNIDQLTLTRTGSVDVSTPGSYFVQYTVCDPIGNCSNPFLLQVDVQDTVAPVVSLLGANPLVVDVYNSNYADPGVNSSDNYYSSNSLIRITEKNVNVNKLGNYNITYIVRDGSGNETRVVRDVQVVDRIAPTIEILGGNPFDLAWMDTFNMPNEIRINDNYDAAEALLPLVQKTTNLTVDPATGKFYGAERGWKEITYQVKDASGNISAKVRRTIYVDFRSGLTEKNTSALAIYPNPSNGKFTIGVNQAIIGNANVIIYNVLGAKVFDNTVVFNGTNAEVNAQELKAGIYLVQVTNNGNTFTQKITIK